MSKKPSTTQSLEHFPEISEERFGYVDQRRLDDGLLSTLMKLSTMHHEESHDGITCGWSFIVELEYLVNWLEDCGTDESNGHGRDQYYDVIVELVMMLREKNLVALLIANDAEFWDRHK